MSGEDDSHLKPEAAKFQWRRMTQFFPQREDLLLDQKVPKTTNVNLAMGRLPDHPFNKDMEASHPCADVNTAYHACFNQESLDSFKWHERVCHCYTQKTELQQCLSKLKKQERQQRQAAEQ